jgi:nitroreductase
MDIRDAIYQRRAVRQYTSQPVDRDTLRHLIDAAVQAPSAVNQQPWLFAVVQERALLDRISEEAKAYMLKQSPAGLVSHHLRDTLGDPGFHIFYHAPALVLICTRTPTPWAVEDCALAAENLMLAACAAGLGTCWIGFAQNWLGTPEGKSAVGLPAGCVPVAPIIVGHPKAPAPPVPRKEPEIRWIG